MVTITEEGILCNGEECERFKAQGAPCTDCPLNQVFAVMFAYCDPLNCQKIKCAGCHYRYFYEKRRQEIEDDQFSTLET